MIIPADEENFEAPILALKQQIDDLAAFSADEGNASERERLRAELQRLRREIYSRLTPWQKTLVARHPQRPYTLDYVGQIFEEFVEVHGDRRFADDPAIITGFARFHGRPVCIVGHQKGRDTKSRIHRNFGMPRPEGYRKALRVMKMAEKFRKPVFTLVDTPGAYPGIGAEERGQAEAIALNLREMARLRVPVLVTVIGEGGSGGALAIAIGDRILMLEHAIYSVISPEGCASILFRSQDREKTRDAARSLRLTASDLLGFGVIDEIVPEAVGGAHADHREMGALLDRALEKALAEAEAVPEDERVRLRYEKFRRMGMIESGRPA